MTPNFLLYREDKEVNVDTLSVSVIKLIKLYRQMGNSQKECLVHTANWFVNILDCEKIHKNTI